MTQTVKTYYITRDYENELPVQFCNSLNKRYISFQYCRATCNDYLDGEAEIHCDFIQRGNYCDSLVWYANSTPPDNTLLTDTVLMFKIFGNGGIFELCTEIIHSLYYFM